MQLDPEDIPLPEPVLDLWASHKRLCTHYKETGLSFTIDGKLLGDIAEALAAEAFGLKLCAKRTKGVDALAPRGGRSVQIKATADPKAGPAFTPGNGTAEHLIFLQIDFERGKATIAYNGPEQPLRELLPTSWKGTLRLSLKRVRELQAKVAQEQPLRRL